MKTEIFKSYEDFLKREDKTVNGIPEIHGVIVSEIPDNGNEGCWNCIDCTACTNCVDCVKCFSCAECTKCNFCKHCISCKECSKCETSDFCSNSEHLRFCTHCDNSKRLKFCKNCENCSNCIDCSNCFDCSDCNECVECSNCSICSSCFSLNNGEKLYNDVETPDSLIPVVENIHSKILEAVEKNVLNMSFWHTCDTTHCLAGWAIHLAGTDGYMLENLTNPSFAGKMIFEKSSSIKVELMDFHDNQVVAMEKIKERAKKEVSNEAGNN